MATTNSASAVWKGDLKSGAGTISTRSSSLAGAPYDFRKRFEGAPGTNPEELIGAAQAACYSMQLSADLGNAGKVADSIATTATVTLDFVDGAPTITKIHIEVAAGVPGMSDADFQATAAAAKAHCLISRLFKAEITLAAKLI